MSFSTPPPIPSLPSPTSPLLSTLKEEEAGPPPIPPRPIPLAANLISTPIASSSPSPPPPSSFSSPRSSSSPFSSAGAAAAAAAASAVPVATNEAADFYATLAGISSPTAAAVPPSLSVVPSSPAQTNNGRPGSIIRVLSSPGGPPPSLLSPNSPSPAVSPSSPSSSHPSPSPSLNPCVSDSYILHEVLGAGSFGTVYRASSLCAAAPFDVAIKVLDFALQFEQEGSGGADSAFRRFQSTWKEISVTRLLSHPHITRYKHAFVEGEQLWIVMPLMEGGSMKEAIELLFPHGLKDEGALATVLSDVLGALAYLHGEGKIHKDVKAENVLLDREGRAHLADFGVTVDMEVMSDSEEEEDTAGPTAATAAPGISSAPIPPASPSPASSSSSSSSSPFRPRSTSISSPPPPSDHSYEARMRRRRRKAMKSLAFAGTPCWMAPEVIRKEDKDMAAAALMEGGKKGGGGGAHRREPSRPGEASKHSKSKGSLSKSLKEIEEEEMFDGTGADAPPSSSADSSVSSSSVPPSSSSSSSPSAARSGPRHDAYIDAQNQKADIWSVGILALEMAFGSVPHEKADPKKIRQLIVNEPPPSVASYRDSSYTFGSSFTDFLSKCLVKDPTQRSSAAELLNHKFLKKAKKAKYIQEKILVDLMKKRAMKSAREERERKQAEMNQKKKKM